MSDSVVPVPARSLKEQFSRVSDAWKEESAPIFRFWAEGDWWGFPFFSLSASRYFGDKETLCLYWPLGTVVITGPKALDFYAGFCTHRATCLKADGKDIKVVNLILSGDSDRVSNCTQRPSTGTQVLSSLDLTEIDKEAKIFKRSVRPWSSSLRTWDQMQQESHILRAHQRGLVHYDKGDLEGALQDFNEAIRLKPDYAAAFYNRGLAHYVKGDLEGAQQDFNEAIRLKLDDADAFYNRGLAHHAKGDLEVALQDSNKAIRLGYNSKE